MIKLKRSDWVLLGIILLSLLLGVFLYGQLPSRMPMHWNIHGQVDRYGPKAEAVFLFPAITLVMYVLFLVVPKIDPRRQNYETFAGTYTILRWVIVLFMVLMYLVTLLNAWRMAKGQSGLDISTIVPVFVAILYIVMGNYMGRFRHNYFVGIRTPWTLANEEVWRKTHRLGGKLFVLSGLLGLVGVFTQPWLCFVLLVGSIGVTTIILFVYSYLIYNRSAESRN